ncbi:MAG: dTDP-4-dehydrorhamnose 3,5-epimerase [Candidatus Thermoplasmatota archaeon]|nr:dTDP-4-dehydrorhamnose 3,5-epimerase [Candidatus Thermoplasmatota archaeon]MCL5731430.1 dTDP-4-dehydrorhamnose 3,5-epimerase [Candidatus Thermoplasmatota archaeon]
MGILRDAVIIEVEKHSDARGIFFESYKKSDFQKTGIEHEFVQDNYSLSRKNVLRGLHFQAYPRIQGKLVRVLNGRIMDVIVDIRPGSDTFLKWESIELSWDNGIALWVPPGFAHGFIALEDETQVMYKTTAEYDPALDSGIIWNDPKIGIKWPVANPLLSDKDRSLPHVSDLDLDSMIGVGQK